MRPNVCVVICVHHIASVPFWDRETTCEMCESGKIVNTLLFEYDEIVGDRSA